MESFDGSLLKREAEIFRGAFKVYQRHLINWLQIRNAMATANMKINCAYGITAKCARFLFNLWHRRNEHLCALTNTSKILRAQLLNAWSIPFASLKTFAAPLGADILNLLFRLCRSLHNIIIWKQSRMARAVCFVSGAFRIQIGNQSTLEFGGVWEL